MFGLILRRFVFLAQHANARQSNVYGGQIYLFSLLKKIAQHIKHGPCHCNYKQNTALPTSPEKFYALRNIFFSRTLLIDNDAFIYKNKITIIQPKLRP